MSFLLTGLVKTQPPRNNYIPLIFQRKTSPTNGRGHLKRTIEGFICTPEGHEAYRASLEKHVEPKLGISYWDYLDTTVREHILKFYQFARAKELTRQKLLRVTEQMFEYPRCEKYGTVCTFLFFLSAAIY